MHRLRPHHSLCIQFFIGNGYSEKFIDSMRSLIHELENEDNEVIISGGCDSICSFCPNKTGGRCLNEDKVAMIDKRCISALGLETDISLKWSQLRQKAYDNIISCGRLDEICQNCCWKNICLNLSHQIVNKS